MKDNKSIINTKVLVIMALLIAMEVILNRFLSVNAWNIKIGFSFIPVVFAAMFFGPIHAALVGGLGDLIGAVLFPIGAYFPGFTLSAALMGLIWGFFLRKDPSIVKIAIPTLINQFIIGLVVNTFWISFLYGSPYGPLFLTRIFQAVILSIVQIAVTYLMGKAFPRISRELNI